MSRAGDAVAEGVRGALGETVVVGVVDTAADGEIASSADGALGVWAIAVMASTNDATQHSNGIFIIIPLRMRWRLTRIWIQKL